MHNKNKPFRYEVVTVHPHTRVSMSVFGSGNGREADGKCAVQCLEISVSQLTGSRECSASAHRPSSSSDPSRRFVLFSLLSTAC